MRNGIVLRTSRMTFELCSIRHLIVGWTVLVAGCNAVVDFGGTFGGDDKPRRDSGVEDGGLDPDRDGSTDPTRDGGGDPIEAGTPSDGGEDAAITDGSIGDGSSGDTDANMTCGSLVEDCSNDDDDDCDALEDCKDPDCNNAPECCKPNQIPEVSCSGDVDNDCDSLVDCADTDCASSELCCRSSGPEVGSVPCDDGRDNDCDGVVDCEETSCASQAKCCDALGDENTDEACRDGVDNDCDGRKDCLDTECRTRAVCCTPAGAVETACFDNIDDDCDGLVDCQDDNCVAAVNCVGCEATTTTEISCEDSVDNDCDKDRDCQDPDCGGALACCVTGGAENTQAACVDDADNDCDGKTDCADPDCGGQHDCCVVQPENTNEACMDTVDNDCDRKVNCADDSCQGTMACCTHSGAENTMAACTDSVDNDCDGKLNCADPDCAGISTCCSGASGGVTIFASGCCVPDGNTEMSQPNDGKDNDCDGLVDIPVLSEAFPTQGLPTSGDMVSLRFMTEINPNATLQCRTRRQSSLMLGAWTPCPMSGTTVKPFTADPKNAASNGAWITEVRWAFPEGAVSDVFKFKYYTHTTLFGVARCTPFHNDSQWFAKASTRLATPDAGFFRLGSRGDTYLDMPFVRVTYEPPKSSVYEFYLDGSSVARDIYSLRRRFTLSSDQRYLLITRNYRATRSGSCGAGGIAIHKSNRGTSNSNFKRYGCDAIVLNRAGAGVCLVNGASTAAGPEFQKEADSHEPRATGNPPKWEFANKFMFRILLESGVTGPMNFMPKCTAMPCPSGSVFLPDRALFSP